MGIVNFQEILKLTKFSKKTNSKHLKKNSNIFVKYQYFEIKAFFQYLNFSKKSSFSFQSF